MRGVEDTLRKMTWSFTSGALSFFHLFGSQTNNLVMFGLCCSFSLENLCFMALWPSC